MIEVVDNYATGEKARMERLKHHFSQGQVARGMGYSTQLLCDLEKGRRNWERHLPTWNLAMEELILIKENK